MRPTAGVSLSDATEILRRHFDPEDIRMIADVFRNVDAKRTRTLDKPGYEAFIKSLYKATKSTYPGDNKITELSNQAFDGNKVLLFVDVCNILSKTNHFINFMKEVKNRRRKSLSEQPTKKNNIKITTVDEGLRKKASIHRISDFKTVKGAFCNKGKKKVTVRQVFDLVLKLQGSTPQPSAAALRWKFTREILRHRWEERVSNFSEAMSIQYDLTMEKKRTAARWVVCQTIISWIARARDLLSFKRFSDLRSDFNEICKSKGIRTQLSPEEATSVSYILQADPDMNTPDSLKKRHALKSNKIVQKMIKRIWSKLPKCPKPFNDVIDRQIYTWMAKRMLAVFLRRPPSSLESIITNEWSQESKGEFFMGFENFKEATFSFFDVWCRTIEPEDYVDIGKDVTKKIQSNYDFMYSVRLASKHWDEWQEQRSTQQKDEPCPFIGRKSLNWGDDLRSTRPSTPAALPLELGQENVGPTHSSLMINETGGGRFTPVRIEEKQPTITIKAPTKKSILNLKERVTQMIFLNKTAKRFQADGFDKKQIPLTNFDLKVNNEKKEVVSRSGSMIRKSNPFTVLACPDPFDEFRKTLASHSNNQLRPTSTGILTEVNIGNDEFIGNNREIISGQANQVLKITSPKSSIEVTVRVKRTPSVTDTERLLTPFYSTGMEHADAEAHFQEPTIDVHSPLANSRLPKKKTKLRGCRMPAVSTVESQFLENFEDLARYSKGFVSPSKTSIKVRSTYSPSDDVRQKVELPKRFFVNDIGNDLPQLPTLGDILLPSQFVSIGHKESISDRLAQRPSTIKIIRPADSIHRSTHLPPVNLVCGGCTGHPRDIPPIREKHWYLKPARFKSTLLE